MSNKCKCDTCIHNVVCDHNRFGFENCNSFYSEPVYEAVCMAEPNYKEEYPKLMNKIQSLEMKNDELKATIVEMCRQLYKFY